MSANPRVETVSNALALAEEWGLPVFPVKLIPEDDGKTRKVPLTEHGFLDASTNIEQIASWWAAHPSAVVGVPTGPLTKLFVVDVDPEGYDWYKANSVRAECGRVHKTSRGMHLLYRLPAGADVPCSVGKVAKGIDVRGTGGYLVWWPASGNDVLFGGMEDIKEPPAWLLSAVTNVKATVLPIHSDAGGMIPKGERNDRLSREAFRQRKQGATVEQIVAILSTMNEARCNPPMSVDEIQKIAMGKANIQPEQLTQTTSVEEDLPFVDLCDMHAHLQDTYVIKNFLPAKAEAWVLGMPGSGKTFLVTDMALHIANNLPWMGHRVKGGLVVYIGAENARSVERRFAGARDHNPEFKKDAPLVLTPGPVDLKNDSSLDAIMRIVRAAEIRHNQKCVLVAVDTLSRAGGGKEDTEDFGACLKGCGRLKLELETSVLLVHHLGKDPTRGGRGWSGINGGVDLEVLVTEEGDSKVATVTKARDGQDGERIGFALDVVNLGEDIDKEMVTSCVVRPLTAPLQESKRPSGKHQVAILKECEELTSDNPNITWTYNELMDLCYGLGISRSSTRKALLNLKELGYFQPTVGGSRLAYHPQGKREK